ncbi:hypothetical protein GIY56_17775 [Paracoccus sp. YIM 132242]|uniref:Uracil-DNA glycosylase-like domain-containing protein n=1 Tax=Paracoccus lichenicola TaxID=2665644 RepID=A0A6L6HV62_9RHOB|nr:uracil-DNA glycosylase family protein [Paracoccus lichenicola]MTE02141.1 hypothetical protein [Paracoccus lichenicola]
MANYEECLEQRIERAYQASGNQIGWRLLYSPQTVLKGARVALIGLNPGGHFDDPEHARFAMSSGSAYINESWAGARPGTSPLQQQVCELFRLLDVPVVEVLAGNLVPFRSPNWPSLNNRKSALEFGYTIWREMLERAKPSVVVSMGKDANPLVRQLLDVVSVESHSVNWGPQRLHVGNWHGGKWLGLPHLSQYKIMRRPESRPALMWALERMDLYRASGK